MRLSEVDLEASRTATLSAETPGETAAAPPAAESAKPRRVVTDESLRLGGTGSAASGETASFSVPQHGSLQISVPQSWRLEVYPSEDDGLPAVYLRAPTPQSPRVQLSPSWSLIGDPAFNRPEQIRSQMETVAQRLLPIAVETEIRLNALQTASGEGYWFAFTKREPHSGKLRFVTQGALPSGDLLVNFTVISLEDAGKDLQTILAALKTLRQTK
jgi:hypothetical protein